MVKAWHQQNKEKYKLIGTIAAKQEDKLCPYYRKSKPILNILSIK